MADQATKGKGIKFCPIFIIIILLFITFGDRNYANTTIGCRIKVLSLQDKTEGEYAFLMSNYQQN